MAILHDTGIPISDGSRRRRQYSETRLIEMKQTKKRSALVFEPNDLNLDHLFLFFKYLVFFCNKQQNKGFA